MSTHHDTPIVPGDDLLTAGDLAARAHITTGAVTGVLNPLERAGYITRRPDPSDRRRVRVAAEPAALARVREIYEPYHARMNALCADYSAEEVAVQHDWFSRASASAAAHLEEHCAPG
jgi:DNA-binding MarR family transcriptional regulator